MSKDKQDHSRARKRVWVQNVAVSAESLDARLNALAKRIDPTPEQAELITGIREMIHRSRAAAYRQDPIPTRWAIWWRGTLIEAAYQNLHAAEALIVRLYSSAEVDAEMTEAVARVEAGLNHNDRRRLEAGKALSMPAGESKRAVLTKLIEIGYGASDRLHSRLRNFRNTVLVAAAALAVFLGAFVGAVAAFPKAVPLCFHPSQGTSFCPTGGSSPSSSDVLVIALLGLLGGTLAAAVAIRNLRGTSTPYGLPIALALLKVPFGVLSAIGGLIALTGEFVPGLTALDSQGQILAYALLFGYAQQLLTGLIDKQAESLLREVPSKDSLSSRPEILPTAPPPTEQQPAAPAVPASAAVNPPSPRSVPPSHA